MPTVGAAPRRLSISPKPLVFTGWQVQGPVRSFGPRRGLPAGFAPVEERFKALLSPSAPSLPVSAMPISTPTPAPTERGYTVQQDRSSEGALEPAPSSRDGDPSFDPNDKPTLRRAARQRRLDAAEAAGHAAADTVAAHVLSLLAGLEGGPVGGYAAKGSELSCWPALTLLSAHGRTVALPKIVGPTDPLAWLPWQPGGRLIDGRFGVQVPADDGAPVRPRVLLVPMLAFTADGCRLGYGGGFFDRSIAALRQSGSLTAIGIAYAGQAVDRLAVEPHDQRLDAIATEHAAWWCAAPGD